MTMYIYIYTHKIFVGCHVGEGNSRTGWVDAYNVGPLSNNSCYGFRVEGFT